jgi:hypothetical protein
LLQLLLLLERAPLLLACISPVIACSAAAVLPADRYNMITGEHIEFMEMRNDMFQVSGAAAASFCGCNAGFAWRMCATGSAEENVVVQLQQLEVF